jgi:endonuclease/exonuclease/phosphatase family metal-dependent hydrolase
MKIISYNVNNDYRNINTKANVILQLILQYDLDLICLQEVISELYKLLILGLPRGYAISNKLESSFFNVIISRQNKFSYYKFQNSSMSRGCIINELSNYLIVNTHLESAPCNQHIRQLQCNEIIDVILQNINQNIDNEKISNKNIIIIGDMNFTNLEETFPSSRINLLELQTNNANTLHDLFTYDSKYNLEAIKPFRTNLDRIYISMPDKQYSHKLQILNNITISDHYPILAILDK